MWIGHTFDELWPVEYEGESKEGLNQMKCKCENVVYLHVKPHKRTHRLHKWECSGCGHQFTGT